ncbi:hypothetical protein PIB30_070067 [Stylosanthes scabra]|uniref:Uncharacterized protein n=1 Tax=Stylosanthes scabra TaxID=79078 RepID=A0ABU6TQQ6_9FABA|nr:hypothetical protein [Stylosanthes scabra]
MSNLSEHGFWKNARKSENWKGTSGYDDWEDWVSQLENLERKKSSNFPTHKHRPKNNNHQGKKHGATISSSKSTHATTTSQISNCKGY